MITIGEIFCSTARYMNSFFPDAIKIWNNIDIEFHSCTSLSIFKRNILNLIRPESKTVFGIHDPIALKRLFQLRVQLSPLKSHKRRHNFSDTPSDWCDCNCAPEDTKHFLQKCSLFHAPRRGFHISVLNILMANNLLHLADDVKLYLYGHHSMKPTGNKLILLSIIKFIKNTGRLSE